MKLAGSHVEMVAPELAFNIILPNTTDYRLSAVLINFNINQHVIGMLLVNFASKLRGSKVLKGGPTDRVRIDQVTSRKHDTRFQLLQSLPVTYIAAYRSTVIAPTATQEPEGLYSGPQ